MFCVRDDGNRGEIVVSTTDLCTLNLIATLAHNGKDRYKVRHCLPKFPQFVTFPEN